MTLTPELYEVISKIVEDKVKKIKVTKEAFDKLSSGLSRLAEAQARTEETLKKLIERSGRFENAISRLAEAQARTEERVSSLENAISRLAEAQARTEERVSSLENAISRLAEAQARTEERVNELVITVQSLARSVGSLSDTVGFGLEDIAKVVLPGWLQRNEGIIVEKLERRFFSVDGEEIEVNLYGEGMRNGRKVVVVGEAKSRIYGDDVWKFHSKMEKIKHLIKEDVFRVMFGYLIHPSAEERAKELGIAVVASYMR